MWEWLPGILLVPTEQTRQELRCEGGYQSRYCGVDTSVITNAAMTVPRDQEYAPPTTPAMNAWCGHKCDGVPGVLAPEIPDVGWDVCAGFDARGTEATWRKSF